MKANVRLADISHSFFEKHKVYRYRMKKIEAISDEECIQKCHWFCEENHLVEEFEAFRQAHAGDHWYCRYLGQFVEEGLCYDIQMLAGGYIQRSALPDCEVDVQKACQCCESCGHNF